eukprot:PhM_4_TR18883/c0_g1_i14/m.76579
MRKSHKQRPKSQSTDQKVTVLSADRAIAFYLQREQLRPTAGEQCLRKAHDRYGNDTKDEFTLCLAGVRGMCPAGEACRDIHVDFSVFGVDTRNWSMQDVTEFVPHSTTHSMANYANLPRHDAGQRVPVYDHRSQQTTYVDSDSVIITAGSRGYFQSLLPNGDGERTEPRRMQQCTHFHKRICLRGADCSFLHLLPATVPQHETPPPATIDEPKRRKTDSLSSSHSTWNVSPTPSTTSSQQMPAFYMHPQPQAAPYMTGQPMASPFMCYYYCPPGVQNGTATIAPSPSMPVYQCLWSPQVVTTPNSASAPQQIFGPQQYYYYV